MNSSLRDPVLPVIEKIVVMRDGIIIPIGFAAYYYPSLVTMGILAALPWIAVILFAITRRLNQFMLSLPLAVSGLVFFLLESNKLMSSFQADWTAQLPRACVVAGILSLLLISLPDGEDTKDNWWVARVADWVCRIMPFQTARHSADEHFFHKPRTLQKFVIYFCLFTMYAYGIISQANMLFDKSIPIHYQTAILSKSEQRYFSTVRLHEYHFVLRPWGNFSEPQRIGVSNALYLAAGERQKICVDEHAGAAGILWYRLSLCR